MTIAVDLELTLRPAGGVYHAEARCRPPESDAPIDAVATIMIDQARLLALTTDPAAYGRALGEMVLTGMITNTVAQARAVAQQRSLLVRLRLALPADLQILRWETLRDPADPDAPLLTTSGQILFSRYLSSADWTPVQPRPLTGRRGLVLLASPPDLADYGLALFDVKAEWALIEQSLEPLPTTMLGVGQATLDALIEALRSGPDILYILAHGRVDADGETWLYLEGADGKTAPVRGSEVATRIAEQAVRPQLIVLGSCESAGDGHGEALLALGPRLAQAGVSAVLAMQDKVTLETLQSFLSTCLQVLAREGQIDQAMAIARGVVRDRPDFWVPVLFLRVPSGQLWAMPEELVTCFPSIDPQVFSKLVTDLVSLYKAYTDDIIATEQSTALPKNTVVVQGEQVVPLLKAAIQQHGEPKEQMTLALFEDDPATYETALVQVLIQLTKRSSAFAQQLQVLAAQVPASGIKSTVAISGNAQVGTMIGVNMGTVNTSTNFNPNESETSHL